MRYLLGEWLVDVATDLAGKCALIALALTFIERCILDERPASWLVAGRRGSGKTTALKMIFEARTGQPTVAAGGSSIEEERRKALHSYLIGGVPYILWNNIPRGATISCPHIERALTSKYYEDRTLGASETVRTAATSIIAFTGKQHRPEGRPSEPLAHRTSRRRPGGPGKPGVQAPGPDRMDTRESDQAAGNVHPAGALHRPAGESDARPAS